MNIIPFAEYYEKYENGIDTFILPAIEAEIVHAMQRKDNLFYKLGYISN